jgi:histidine decarboxylase
MNANRKIPHAASPEGRAARLATGFTLVESRMRAAHATHLGYPYNLSFTPGVPAALNSYLINNLGDPYVGSHYASDVCTQEREVITWLMRLWGCADPDAYWGSVGTSGTEGNLWALYLGREMLPDAVLLHSADAHYSLPKAARILRIPAIEVASRANGEIDLDDLSDRLAGLKGRPVILALTCGTTMKGAHDDITGALWVLGANGYDRDSRYVHVDGALNAMVVPFLQDAPPDICPSFETEIDSISTSGHKMIGTPMPCGVLIARKPHSARIAKAVAYLRSDDTTLMGSRGGHAVLAIWARLMGLGYGGFAQDAITGVHRAQALARRLRDLGLDVLCNPYGLTVVFDEPCDEIVRTYQLACAKGRAHAIVMPSVTDTLLDQFVTEYTGWWQLRARGDVAPGDASQEN